MVTSRINTLDINYPFLLNDNTFNFKLISYKHEYFNILTFVHSEPYFVYNLYIFRNIIIPLKFNSDRVKLLFYNLKNDFIIAYSVYLAIID